MNRDLRNQVRGIAESVDAESFRVTSLSIRTIAEHSGTEQWCYFNIVVVIRQTKTVSRVGNGELGIPAVDVVTGKLGAVAKILVVRSTISAIAIGPAKPRNADPIADFELLIVDCRLLIDRLCDLLDASDNLMAENERQFRIVELAVNDVKIGPANCAGIDRNE